MGKKITVMIIPNNNRSVQQFHLPEVFFRYFYLIAILVISFSGYLILDYIQLLSIKTQYKKLVIENSSIKSEARALATSLDQVKGSLKKVESYSEKLVEFTKFKLDTVSRQTGIGPLTKAEFATSKITRLSPLPEAEKHDFPLGLNIDSLAFKPIFERLKDVNNKAESQAFQLQRLLTTLSQQKSLLNSIPSVAPVNGWMASGYGWRVSPFSGQRDFHEGLDIAAPVGSPVFSPADGVVIFSGSKEGYGNYIMIAHGYGIVSAYGHGAQTLVQVGQRVRRGEQIGTVGSTGRSTGPHCHYEVYVNSKSTNPAKFILDRI